MERGYLSVPSPKIRQTTPKTPQCTDLHAKFQKISGLSQTPTLGSGEGGQNADKSHHSPAGRLRLWGVLHDNQMFIVLFNIFKLFMFKNYDFAVSQKGPKVRQNFFTFIVAVWNDRDKWETHFFTFVSFPSDPCMCSRLLIHEELVLYSSIGVARGGLGA